MGKVAILYGTSTGATEFVANKIQRAIGDAVLYDVKDFTEEDLSMYDLLILGSPTVKREGLQEDWEKFLPRLAKQNLKEKKIALFGLGDGEVYPESFVDGMGLLYKTLNDKTIIVGSVPTSGYFFDQSDAIVGGRFVGLPIDEDNESDLTDIRITPWINELKQYM